MCITYKSPAPRAADAARYARARQGRMQLKTCKGGRKKRPMIWCEQRFDNAKSCLCRANCPVCAQLCCVLLLPVLRSDRQYGGYFAWGKTGGRERSNTCRKIKKKRSGTHNAYYTRYCSMFQRKHTAQHDTAPQQRAHGTAPHGSARLRTALRCATLRCWAV